MSPFLLCRGVAVPWRCLAVALCVTLRLRCVCCIVLRCVCCVRCVAVAFRCASGCCASFQAVLSRFGWLFPAAPGLSVLFRAPLSCSVLFCEARRAQNQHFCALFGFGTPIFRPFEHKIGILVSEWAFFPRFLVVLTQKWGFCAREA